MKFFSKAKLDDDDNIQYLVQKNHSHPYQKQGLQDDENSYQKSESGAIDYVKF